MASGSVHTMETTGQIQSADGLCLVYTGSLNLNSLSTLSICRVPVNMQVPSFLGKMRSLARQGLPCLCPGRASQSATGPGFSHVQPGGRPRPEFASPGASQLRVGARPSVKAPFPH